MATETQEKPVRLKELYINQYRAELQKELELKSVMQVPKLEKIVVNIGTGSSASTPKLLESAVEEMATITGQQPVKTRAKKSIAGFKLRENMQIGAMVTLRGNVMYEFFDRLVNIALPRVRDFNGVSAKSFDKQGNYTLGIKEQIIFPEINFDQVDSVHGFDVTLVIRSEGVEHSRAFLDKFGFPFKK